MLRGMLDTVDAIGAYLRFWGYIIHRPWEFQGRRIYWLSVGGLALIYLATVWMLHDRVMSFRAFDWELHRPARWHLPFSAIWIDS